MDVLLPSPRHCVPPDPPTIAALWLRPASVRAADWSLPKRTDAGRSGRRLAVSRHRPGRVTGFQRFTSNFLIHQAARRALNPAPHDHVGHEREWHSQAARRRTIPPGRRSLLPRAAVHWRARRRCIARSLARRALIGISSAPNSSVSRSRVRCRRRLSRRHCCPRCIQPRLDRGGSYRRRSRMAHPHRQNPRCARSASRHKSADRAAERPVARASGKCRHAAAPPG